MTQVKLWQIVSQTANAIIFSDADGNLKTLAAGSADKVLVSGPDGLPMWADNTALVAALQAQTDAGSALAAAKAYTEAQIAALVDNAPVALNTLNELAVKLNGEDSAINALLLQVDGKAEKTEVATQIAQAKQDAIQTAYDNTTTAVANAMNGIDPQLNALRGDMITYADLTANFKADAARSEAITFANDFTTQAVAEALQNAGNDATAKADAAKSDAITEANAYADGILADGVATVTNAAQGFADDARNDAVSTASNDATAKVASLRSSIPQDFFVVGHSIGCFVATSGNLDANEAIEPGLKVSQHFVEVTGASVSADDDGVSAKLLFVNGVAMSGDWTAARTGNQLHIKFGAQLAHHVFDGTQNAIMLLVEYRRDNAILLQTSSD